VVRSGKNQKSQAKIRRALQGEAGAISSLAIRSKAHWGYSSEFLDACREELSYSEAQVASTAYEFWVCDDARKIIGFYALELMGPEEAELEALFVEPNMIGRGFGQALIEHAKDRAATLGIRQITIQGDPNAVSFYEAAGGVRDGQRESASIPGRFLPIFRIAL
jgi:GNAT superfamily N-acetyltransferase